MENTGSGNLLVKQGGIVESHKSTSPTQSSGIIGADVDSQGSATVRDADSRWTQDGVLNVGWWGNGELTIGAGGLVESQKGIIGRLAGSTGIVSINGTDARWAIDEELHVGGKPFDTVGGTAIMTISNGGMVQVGTNINIWPGGVLSITDDANLGAAPPAYNPDYLHIDGGRLAASDNVNLDANRGITIASGGAIVEVATDKTMRFLSLTAGGGDLNKTGAGTLILAGTPSYLGSTQIGEGWLRIETSANLHGIAGLGDLGIGNEFVNAEVTADSVSVNALSIADGSTLIIKPLSDGSLAGMGRLASVPEPSAITLLVLCAIAGLLYRHLCQQTA